MENKKIEEINKKIKELKELKLKTIEEIKEEKRKKRNTNNNGCSNILRRMSVDFFNKMDYVDKKREENGYDIISLPEKTSLVVKHILWKNIQEDLIHYNKKLNEEGCIQYG